MRMLGVRTERRREERHSTALLGHCQLPNGSSLSVEITNLSSGGCRLAEELDVVAGEPVRLSVAGMVLAASVIWIKDGMTGIALSEALEPELVTYLVACCRRAA